MEEQHKRKKTNHVAPLEHEEEDLQQKASNTINDDKIVQRTNPNNHPTGVGSASQSFLSIIDPILKNMIQPITGCKQSWAETLPETLPPPSPSANTVMDFGKAQPTLTHQAIVQLVLDVW
jgi:hypothetical protein